MRVAYVTYMIMICNLLTREGVLIYDDIRGIVKLAVTIVLRNSEIVIIKIFLIFIIN